MPIISLLRVALLGALVLMPLSVRPAEAADQVKIAVSSNSFVLGGLRIAQQAGLFTKHDLDPQIIVMDSGNAALSALISGSVQYAVSGPGEVLAARVRRQPVVILINLYRGLAGSIVLGRSVADKLTIKPDASVDDRLRALNGLSIAVPSATSALLTPVRGAAEKLGVKINFVYMAQPAMAAALESGAVQGIIASSPFWGATVVKGSGVLWINGPGGELPAEFAPTSSSCLQGTESYVAANHAVVRRLQDVFLDLASFIDKQPQEALADLAKAYATLDRPTLELSFAKEHDNWTHPQFSVDDMRHEIAIQQSNSLLPGVEKIDPDSLLRWQQ